MHLQYLIKDGKITTKEGEPRTIKLLKFELVREIKKGVMQLYTA
jgi:hypothetical protein